MSTGFITNSVIALAAGFLVVASQAFSPSTTGWLAFAIAIGTLAVACLAQADRSRGIVQRALDGAIALLSAWTIVASVVFDGRVVTWLTLGESIGLVGLAYVGLNYHEYRRHKGGRHAAETVEEDDALRVAA
jgi:hypothetical protein